MLPQSTYVLDHTLPVSPDHLFDIVEDFVSAHLSDTPQPLGPGLTHFTLAGVEWAADHRTIHINVELFVPRQENQWHLREGKSYEIKHTKSTRWGEPCSDVLVRVETVPAEDGNSRARIVAHPGTEAEQLAIRLAAHIVRETACTSYRSHDELVVAQDAAHEKWVKWLEARITRMMIEKQTEERAFVFPVERRVTLRSLETTVDIFMRRLRVRTKLAHLERFYTDTGFISLRAHYVPGRPEQDRLPSMYFFAWGHTIKEGVEAKPPTPIGPVIFVQVHQLGPCQIDVVARCTHLRVEVYFEQLVGDVRGWYPEARVERKREWRPTGEKREATKAELVARLLSVAKRVLRLMASQRKPDTGEGNSDSAGGQREAEATAARGQAEAEATEAIENGQREPPFPGFPKSEAAIEKWRKSYRVICGIRREYRGLFEDDSTDDPNPTDDDLRGALANMSEWKKKPSLITVQRIKRAGDEGLLKQV